MEIHLKLVYIEYRHGGADVLITDEESIKELMQRHAHPETFPGSTIAEISGYTNTFARLDVDLTIDLEDVASIRSQAMVGTAEPA